MTDDKQGPVLGVLPDGRPYRIYKGFDGSEWTVTTGPEGTRLRHPSGIALKPEFHLAERLHDLADDTSNLARFIARQLTQGRSVHYACASREGAREVENAVKPLVDRIRVQFACSWSSTSDAGVYCDTVILDGVGPWRRIRAKARAAWGSGRPLIVDWSIDSKSAFPKMRWELPGGESCCTKAQAEPQVTTWEDRGESGAYVAPEPQHSHRGG